MARSSSTPPTNPQWYSWGAPESQSSRPIIGYIWADTLEEAGFTAHSSCFRRDWGSPIVKGLGKGKVPPRWWLDQERVKLSGQRDSLLADLARVLVALKRVTEPDSD